VLHDAAMSSAERLLRDDLDGAAFSAGVDRGYWRLRELSWPHAVIEIAAAARPNGPEWFGFRFDLIGYPAAPTAQPWDADVRGPLPPARWPGGCDRIQRAFNPTWRMDAVYVPMDRLAFEGHDAWRTQYSAYLWDEAGDITQYLRLLHSMLNDDGYHGVRG
jgi:hypothetical protein